MKEPGLPGRVPVEQIPDVVIQRLPLYARTLSPLAGKGVEAVSSLRLGEMLGATPTQIRKDLSYFGRFGKQGTGYNVAYLLAKLKQILGLEEEWPMALVGVGRLGQDTPLYPGFAAAGFRFSALFDTDQEKVRLRVEGKIILSVEEMPDTWRARGIEIALLAVLAVRAHQVTELLLEGGVKAILNCAPVSLRAPPSITVRSIDPVLVLQSMTFYLNTP